MKIQSQQFDIPKETYLCGIHLTTKAFILKHAQRMYPILILPEMRTDIRVMLYG